MQRRQQGDPLTVRKVADAALRRSPAQLVSRRLAARRLAVLAYHGVDDPAQFARHLDLITDRAQPVDVDVVLDALAGRRLLPDRAVLVTFDDGHRSVFEQAMPLLRERGVPAVLFVLPGVLDTDRPFWWTEVHELVRASPEALLPGTSPDAAVRRLKQLPDDERRAEIEQLRRSWQLPPVRQPQLTRQELRTLQMAGIEIGNHTTTHPCLDRCSPEVVRDEIEGAHSALASMLGRAPRTFAYPNGNWDPRAEWHLERLGYQLGFLFDHRLARLSHMNPLRLSRLRVNSDTSMDRLATIISGLHPAVHHARGGV